MSCSFNKGKVFAKALFRLRSICQLSLSSAETAWAKLLGSSIAHGSYLRSSIITWHHQIKIGHNCRLEHGIYFHYDGIHGEGPSIIIGNDCFVGALTEFNVKRKCVIGDGSLIAAGCKFIDHDHALDSLTHFHGTGKTASILIGKNVWLGANVIVLKGVTIGDGSVVGAGSIVIKSIPPRQIWAGVPAKKIRDR